MDISKTLAPKSDQMDYEDLISSPLTLTIKEVRKGPSAEQPVEVVLEEFDRPWRPAKTVRRILVACWGADSSVYVGRRITLFGDASVTWAGEAVGGIRLSHASHIDGPVTVALTVRRGKRAPFTVQPLPNAVDADLEALRAAINTAPTLENLQLVWKAASAAGYTGQLVAAKDARKAELAANPA